MLLINRIRCEDDTVLTSRYFNDFQYHLGVGIDGGNDFPRRFIKNGTIKFIDLSIPDDGTIEKAREHLEWPSFGKDAGFVHMGGPRYLKLKNMSDAHIESILQKNGEEGTLYLTAQYIRYFKAELEYREKNNIVVKESIYE